MKHIIEILKTVINNIFKSYYYLKYFGLKAFLKKIKIKLFFRYYKIFLNIKPEQEYKLWISKNEPNQRKLNLQRNFRFNYKPKITILLSIFENNQNYLIETINSIIEQTYQEWELIIINNFEIDKTFFGNYIQNNKKLKFFENGNSKDLINLISGEYIIFLESKDKLAPFALFEIVKVLNNNSDYEFIYSDEDHIDDNNNRFEPYFKPDFSPDTLRSYNYISKSIVIKKGLLLKVGDFDINFNGTELYNLILKLTEITNKIYHIPKMLFHIRNINSNDNSYDNEKVKMYIKQHLLRLGLKGNVEDGLYKGTYKVKYDLKDNFKVSIIILNKDLKEDLQICIESIIKKTTYKNYEIIIIENGSTTKEIYNYYEYLRKNYNNIFIYKWLNEFNFSTVNNFAVEKANGDVYLFLNNDTEVITPDWLQEMLQFVQREDVGIVGAKLYYQDNTIQHAGVIIGIGGAAGHSHKNYNKDSLGYHYRLVVTQNLSAVTGACMMIRKNVFKKIAGFDENFKMAFGDVDICLKAIKNGYKIVWTPYAELYHYESKTRGIDNTPRKIKQRMIEMKNFKDKWKEFFINGDPFYNPNLNLIFEDFSINIF